MKNVFGWLFWSAIFVVLLVGMDRYLVETRSEAPVVSQVQAFYRDFRQRLAGIFSGRKEDGVAAVIEKTATTAPGPRAVTVSGGEPKFLYVDSGGKLHFAASLDEVPPPYRNEVQPLGE